MVKSAIARATLAIAFAIGMFAMLLAEPASAQHRGPHGSTDERLELLQRELELTPTQVDQIRQILTEKEQELRELKEGSSDRSTRHEAFRQLREETHERIAAVLTDEQRQRFQELRDRHHGGRGHGRAEGTR